MKRRHFHGSNVGAPSESEKEYWSGYTVTFEIEK